MIDCNLQTYVISICSNLHMKPLSLKKTTAYLWEQELVTVTYYSWFAYAIVLYKAHQLHTSYWFLFLSNWSTLCWTEEHHILYCKWSILSLSWGSYQEVPYVSYISWIVKFVVIFCITTFYPSSLLLSNHVIYPVWFGWTSCLLQNCSLSLTINK
jgi:hypothetical protein